MTEQSETTDTTDATEITVDSRVESDAETPAEATAEGTKPKRTRKPKATPEVPAPETATPADTVYNVPGLGEVPPGTVAVIAPPGPAGPSKEVPEDPFHGDPEIVPEIVASDEAEEGGPVPPDDDEAPAAMGPHFQTWPEVQELAWVSDTGTQGHVVLQPGQTLVEVKTYLVTTPDAVKEWLANGNHAAKVAGETVIVLQPVWYDAIPVTESPEGEAK
jgi:hypothetical protein